MEDEAPKADFEIIRLIGSGAYGEVYLARDLSGGYRAVKVIFRESFEHDRPFEREYEGLRKFEVVSRSYDNQVQVLHVGRREDPRQFYYIMELADDQNSGQTINPETYVPKTLSSELKRRARLPMKECASIAAALARALEDLHANGLIHRDIKPANIIFVNGRPKLADIGLVTDADVSVSHVGTEGFIPPEGPGSPQGDIYSLGKVLYEMCTGRSRMDFPDLPSALEDFDDREMLLEFNAIIARACECDPRRRYQTARQMLDDIICVQRGLSVRRRRGWQRRLALAAGAGAALALCGVILGIHYYRQPGAARNQAPQANAPADRQETSPFVGRTAWWREAKFGLFIHWGLYSIPADSTLKNHAPGRPDCSAEWYMANKRMPVSEYEQFASQFNPVQFNAREWVGAARNAGMKYIVITAKHHDGFCMFESRYTTFNVVHATPYRRDPMKELAAECQRQGLRLCFFYSILDWHHPDFLPRPKWDQRPSDGADFNRYAVYLRNQVAELLSNYGPVGSLWFNTPLRHTSEELQSNEAEKMARSLQPGILINDLLPLDASRNDFDSKDQMFPPEPLSGDRGWETALPMNDNYGYNRADHNWKSSTDLIRRLCRVVHSGGNFLLNVGPTAKGQFPPESLQRLAEIGAWLKANGQAIYGASQSPFRNLPAYVRCTAKGDRLFLIVFDWTSGELPIAGLLTPVKGARVLGTGEKVSAKPDPGLPGWRIAHPSKIDPAATVVELQFDAAPQVAE